jgi:hypothetical protein
MPPFALATKRQKYVELELSNKPQFLLRSFDVVMNFQGINTVKIYETS